MNYFRYICLSILFFLSTNIYASCPSGNTVVSQTFAGNVGSLYCVQYHSSNCKVLVQSGTIILDGGPLPYATLTGETCEYIETPPLPEGCTQLPNGSIECEEEEEEEPDDPVLQCSTDSCPNPQNKRCPVGYTRGSFNGQNLCVKHKSNDDDNDDDQECNDPNGCDESNDEIIGAIDRANNDITNSTNSLGQTLTNGFNSLKNALADIADKLQNLADSMTNGNNDTDQNTNQPPDTSQFNANLPVEDVEINQNLDTGLYSSNSQCPAKKIINIPQYGLHYEFDFSEICNMLQIFGYLVLLFAYVVAARIVIKS